MAAGSSNGAALVAIVDDFYFSVLAHGRNDDSAAGDDVLFPISDEKYATELQLQEVIMSSAIAATARSSAAPPRSRSSTDASASSSNNAAAAAAAAAATSGHSQGKCAYASSSRPSVSVAAAVVFCKICMDVVPPSDVHRASRGCAHSFCGRCLAGYLGAKIQERIAEVRCPEERCGGVLDPELCQDILPRDVFERWGAALCESLLLGGKRAYCPFKDCSAMMLVDDGSHFTESECPSCRRLFCASCNVAPWHAGVTCTEYRNLGKRDSGVEDRMLLEMAKGKKWKRCPKCEYFVEKRDGCLHITCRCGFEFCYGCGKKWTTSHSRCTTA
ncbi:probable E3 ubiquitin-protein ligase RNF217 [Zea mays]|uniref:RBR-type E3 ubiquitin transferase n=2 Tax=Zea mays TaxID=4577 RepID=A0A804NQ01_MAIZE|nr:probable E3 ubiquitin-protein ligase RNF217 [Zea mays]|eukprot:XP_008678484.1 probable E3 ubiquitin-protein ligase RNF217 [Zea mays]